MNVRPLVAVLATAAFAVAASPASAAAEVRIADLSSTGGEIRVVVSAPEAVNPADVEVRIDGVEVVSSATTSAKVVRRTAVLAVDTSGSMAGGRLPAAVEAIRAYVTALPADVRVGLVQFADKATTLAATGTDRAPVLAATGRLRADGETALYDGVLLAVQQAGAEGVRSVVVLSDGADTVSKTGLDAVALAAKTARVTVDAVALGTTETTQGLRTLAARTGGRLVTTTEVSSLPALFKQAASAWSGQLVVTAPVPAALAGRQVAVRITAGRDTDEAVAVLAAAPLPAPAGPLPGSVVALGSTWLVAGLAALFLGLLVVLAVSLGVGSNGTRGRLQRRLARYGPTPAQEPGGLTDNVVARSAVELASRVVHRRDIEEHLSLRLAAAGLPLRPAEWLLLHMGIALSTTLLVMLLTGGRLASALAALAVALVLPWAYLGVKAERRRREFHGELPDTLQLLSGSMAAGYSFPQACDLVAREGPDPIAGEFTRALATSRLGVPIEDGLDEVAVRMGSRDFGWVVMAVRIHREVGGSLAEVLTNAAHTLRERERVRRQVRALSAEGRISCYILGALPPVFMLYLALVRPSYLQPLFTDPIGVALLVGMGISLFVGFVWMRAVSRVEV